MELNPEFEEDAAEITKLIIVALTSGYIARNVENLQSINDFIVASSLLFLLFVVGIHLKTVERIASRRKNR